MAKIKVKADGVALDALKLLINAKGGSTASSVSTLFG